MLHIINIYMHKSMELYYIYDDDEYIYIYIDMKLYEYDEYIINILRIEWDRKRKWKVTEWEKETRVVVVKLAIEKVYYLAASAERESKRELANGLLHSAR